ncbi:MAG: GntR family transcriptional regulator [Victivallaceae bacterium]|jgi:DNA-binding transcriptional regulator YhcF (GntR family)
MFNKDTIRKESSVPVYQQLIKYFEEFISSNPPETRVPPERELAALLNVSRNSLRKALEYYFDKGLIVRQRRKGTFTALNSKTLVEEPVSLEEIHPQAYYDLMMFQEPAKGNTLTLTLYENMPFQKKYWEEIVKKFNSRHPETKAVIEWLPKEISIREKHGFENYFKSIGKIPDLIQCPLDKSLYDLFTPLPDEIRAFMTSSKFFHETLEAGGEYLLERIVPIYTSVPICLWNKDMGEKYEITDIRKKLEHGSVIELACHAAEKLPLNIKICGPMPTLMRFWGHPEHLSEINSDSLKRFFIPLCREINKVKGDHERVFPLYFRNYPIKGKFLAGLHFMDFMLSSTMFMPLKNHIEFNYETAIFPIQETILFEASSLAISTLSQNKKVACKFLNFMLSHEIQSLTTKMLFTKPFVKSAMPGLYAQLNSTSEIIDKYFNRIKISCGIEAKVSKYQIDYISYGLKDLFEKIATGKIDGEHATATAFDILSNLT